MDYERVVTLYHEDLYRFAFSLSRNADDAAELTQEAYCRLLSKSAQLRDSAKVKSWLFTTLYRIFVGARRHRSRFPHLTIASVEHELPALDPSTVDKIDASHVLEVLLEIEEHHRAPLMLFYLRGLSYREIAKMLEVPVGTVMSRLSRAKGVLRERIFSRPASGDGGSVLPINPSSQQEAH